MNKIEAIKQMIGDYFDWDGVTFHHFMEQIGEIEDGDGYAKLKFKKASKNNE